MRPYLLKAEGISAPGGETGVLGPRSFGLKGPVTLDGVCRTWSYLKTVRVDQGGEFVSRDMYLWAYLRDVVLDFSRPGKPTDNAFIEAFNGRFRAECLNDH